MSSLIGPVRGRVDRFAEAAVERARLTVVPRRSRKAPRVPFVTLVSLLLVGGVAGLLFFNTSMQQASFTATSMEQRAAVLEAKQQSLEMKLEQLRDPQRLAVQAKRLGMVPLESPAFIRLSDGKVLGHPTPALATDAMRITPLPTRKPKDLRPDPVIVKAPAQPSATTAAGSSTGSSTGANASPHRGVASTAGTQAAGKKKATSHHAPSTGHQGSQR
jgi:hypothetical protein